jgi:hypothetical protein
VRLEEWATDVSLLRFDGAGAWKVERTFSAADATEVPAPWDDLRLQWRSLDEPTLSADSRTICARERLEFEGEDSAAAFARILVWRPDGSKVVVATWGRTSKPGSDETVELVGENPDDPGYAFAIGGWEGRPSLSPNGELVAWDMDGRVHVARVP